MAQQYVMTINIIDDLTGQREETGVTVRFAYEGQDYELDLGPVSEEQYHKTMLDFAEKARKVGKPRKLEVARPINTHVDVVDGPPPEGQLGKRKPSKNLNTPSYVATRQRPRIREWAIENGYDVNPNGGRIPKEIEEAYDRAHGVIPE
jgi:hypothetical protein